MHVWCRSKIRNCVANDDSKFAVFLSMISSGNLLMDSICIRCAMCIYSPNDSYFSTWKAKTLKNISRVHQGKTGLDNQSLRAVLVLLFAFYSKMNRPNFDIEDKVALLLDNVAMCPLSVWFLNHVSCNKSIFRPSHSTRHDLKTQSNLVFPCQGEIYLT